MPIYTDMFTVQSTSTDSAAINNSIKNILSTSIGTMPGKPTFGCDLTDALFNQLDHITIDIVENSIRDALQIWEPRILVTSVQVSEVPEFNRVVANIDYEYRDKGFNATEQISVSLNN